jgi:hypothetical protein
MTRSLVVVAVLLAGSVPAHAQSVDSLRTCLMDSTSGKDRKDLVKWIFFAMAAHPELKQYAAANTVTAADEGSKRMGALVSRLLTESCATETKAVMKSGEAGRSLEVAFEGLGKIAMQELMTDKAVQDSMGVFMRYFDQKRLNEMLAGK